jgi:hypothetical protein
MGAEMTKDEALKLALEALETVIVDVKTTPTAYEVQRQAIVAIKAVLAQEQDNDYIYASTLAKTIWQKHWMKESPKFELLDTIEGVLTQIDNMTCRLVREKLAQRTWIGLTDAEITEIRLKSFDSIATNHAVYKAIEAKLREKNGC